MIPIRYDKTVNAKYEDCVKKFRKDIDAWLTRGYVGYKIKGKTPYEIDQITELFFLNIANLMDHNAYWDMSTTELRDFKDQVENDNNFKQILNRNSRFYKVVKHAFVQIGYTSNLNKGAFIEAVGADVCPYCNRTFIKNVKTSKGEVKGELDHFISKDDAPYLALCRYNLVPSCPFCNHGKSNAYNPALVSPYDLSDADGIHFKMDITGKRFTSMDHCASAITITVEDKGGMGANIADFHLQELYKGHADYAAEIYYKGRLKLHRIYRASVKSILGVQGIKVTSEDLDRMYLGLYNEDNFNKRPLSKYMHDLAVNEGIIDEK